MHMRGPLGATRLMIAIALVVGLLLASSANARPFRYRSYAQMAAYLRELNATYPEVLRVFVAQDKYGLPYPPELTCIGDDETKKLVPCQHFVVHLTNHSTLPAHADRPQVFFSGALHGDERIGPITTIEMIALVAEYATAYAHPDSNATLDAATLNTQRWIHHLVNSRNVVITPMTNAYGYSHEIRTELDVDPNRDYNYMRSGADCMQTMTSRVVNEIWREHMFQLAITFHGGMRAVSYEWGSPNHYLPSNRHRSQKSPDDMAQFEIATAMATYAGAFEDGTMYPVGTMNDIVYGVTGGMEDWGYAASWENQFVNAENTEGTGHHKPFKPCKPTTFDGYDPAKTIYNNMTHRAFNILVETSINKHPEEDKLGEFEDIYGAELDFFKVSDVQEVGHVTQNVRMALMLMEFVQPYVRWVDAPLTLPAPVGESFQADAVDRDLFPSANLFVASGDELVRKGCGVDSKTSVQIASCNSTKCHIKLDKDQPLKVQVAWEVLGAITVDETKVQLSTEPGFEHKDIISLSAVQKGKTRRHYDLTKQAKKSEDTTNEIALGSSLFVSCVDLPKNVSTRFYLRAIAKVDQEWGAQAMGDDMPSPHIPPQSHLVNARTNPAWREEWAGHTIQGSLDWFSPVIELTIGASDELMPAPVVEAVTSAPPSNDVRDPSNTPSLSPVATPVPVTTKSVTPATEAPATDAPVEEDDTDDVDGDDLGDDLSADVTTSPVATSQPPAPTTTAPVPVPVTSAPSTPAAISAEGRLKSNAKDKASGNSLLNYGYLTLGIGGIIIILAVTYLYKRVFRSKRRAYVNINQRGPLRSTQVRSARDDDDEDEDDL